jgi:hypothetical protein
LSGVKRLHNPKKWCVLPLSEVNRFEVPLVEEGLSAEQEIGHIAWTKTTYYVDKEEYTEQILKVNNEKVVKRFYLTLDSP